MAHKKRDQASGRGPSDTTNSKGVKGNYFLMLLSSQSLGFWSVVLPMKKFSYETLDQIKKQGHLWKMVIKILHFYILLTMKRDSALINILN